MTILCLSLLLWLAVANYMLHRDVLYPGFLQASLWLFATALFAVTSGMFIPVSDRVFALFLTGVALFSMGAFVASYTHRPVLERNQLLEGSMPRSSVLLALGVTVFIGLALYVNRAIQLASGGPSTNPYINLRYALSVTWEETGGDLGVVSYFIPCAYVFAAITVLRRNGFARPRASRLLVAVAVFMGLVFGVLSSGRSVLLPLLVVVLIMPAVLRVTTPARTAGLLGALVLFLFLIVGLALEKGGTFGSSVHDNWVGMRDTFVLYTVGSIPSFDTFLRDRGSHVDLGDNTFRTVLAVLRGLGFSAQSAPLVQPYADIPMPANVYTVYQPYIKDFGIAGTSILFVLGFAHGLLYRLATMRKPRAVYVFLFSLSLFPLVMQIFQDMYFSVLSLWIQYSAISVLLFGFFREQKLGAKQRLTPHIE